jgi:Family of unknown function (DUF6288)/PDZ domain
MISRILTLLFSVAILGGVSLGSPLQEWPFGTEDGSARRGRDLYNLGLLGAKASDAILGEPKAESGMRRVEGTGERGDDDGPRELRIECLYPGGPAEQAGLRIGDVLVGVGRAKFDDGSSQPLADAIQKAWSGKKASTLVLKVKREGERGLLSLEAPVEPRGKWFAKPTKGAARELLTTGALDWLAEQQLESGGFRETLSGANGAVVLTCMAGLAWIAGGSTLEAGPHAEQLAKAVEFVDANVGAASQLSAQSGSNWNQENWGWVHAGIFLGELAQVSPRSEQVQSLQGVIEALHENQESSGGFAHGPGGPNALGYVELNIVGGLALIACGLARQAGCELDEDKLEKLIEYIEESSSDGVGYSTKDGQRGQGNIGRTAATWLGLRTLGEGKSKLASRFGGYVKRNSSEVLDGHASLMQHIFLAGLAAEAQGGGAAKLYWGAMRRDLILAYSPDGSFQPRPWHESLKMASNSDVSFGDVWTTAAWTCVLLGKPRKDGGGLKGIIES